MEEVSEAVRIEVENVSGHEWSYYSDTLEALHDGINDIILAVMKTNSYERDRALAWWARSLQRSRLEEVVRETIETAKSERLYNEDVIASALEVLNTESLRSVLDSSDTAWIARTCWSRHGIQLFSHFSPDVTSMLVAIQNCDVNDWRLMHTTVLGFLLNAPADEQKSVLLALNHRHYDAIVDRIAQDLAKRTDSVNIEPSVRYLMYERTNLQAHTIQALQTYLDTVYAPVPSIVQPARDEFYTATTQLEQLQRAVA